MSTPEDDASDVHPQSGASNTFKARLAQFSYTPELKSKTVTMPPRTRKGTAAALQDEKLTGVEEKVADSTGGSETPVADDRNAAEPTSPTKTDTATTKRKRTTKSTPSSTPKKPRLSSSQTPSTQPATPENNLKDSLCPNLILVSIGLNPGIQTGRTGHAYSHPTNRYWPTLHASGITPVLHKPSETHDLMDMYGLGHTNIITSIASRDGSTLTTADYMSGAAALDAKIRRFRPEAVAIVGKGIWLEWIRYKKGRKFNVKRDGFEYGWQDPELWIGRKEGEWEGARTFVTTTTSGASTSHSKEERVAIWRPLGEWFEPRREEWMKRRREEKEEVVNKEEEQIV
ncbi:uracil DNA N-glycosylase Thp1 [Knufia obscura]|uniref:Uracil DNA N-glycosylase Thp1 n=1 Tax=Knufia obscura TaxID=1635080 RepID=A0ABR0RYM2_9EURO|nr:uracil DNA N-glycosylase Thp1 [Knufia obscura]